MKKIIALMVVLIVALGMLGCTTEDINAPAEFEINNQEEADEALTDISTDLSGISDSFDEIEGDLSDTN